MVLIRISFDNKDNISLIYKIFKQSDEIKADFSLIEILYIRLLHFFALFNF